MKKKIIMAGVLTATIALGNAAYAAPCTNNENCYKLEMQSEFNILDYLKNCNFLTKQEKQRLLDTEKQMEPHYKKAKRIEKEIDDITDNILKESDGLYDEIENIMNANKALWDKLYENINEEQADMLDMKDFIKASKILNDKEKEILLKDQEKIDSIENQLDKKYDKVEKETENLKKQTNAIYDEIDNIEEKNNDIWNKISKNDRDPILY